MVVVKREGYESKSESCSEQDDDCSRDISTELKKASDSPITKVLGVCLNIANSR